MNKERILRLASRLEKVNPEHFDIRNWWANSTRNEVEEVTIVDHPAYNSITRNKKLIVKEGFCGSTACVLGHAALIKEFNQEGLYIKINDEPCYRLKDITGKGYHQYLLQYEYEKAVKERQEQYEMISYGSIVYITDDNIYYDTEAGSKFFDLTYEEARYLFYAGGVSISRLFYGAEENQEITPDMVATALRKFVETDGESLRDIINEYYGNKRVETIPIVTVELTQEQMGAAGSVDLATISPQS